MGQGLTTSATTRECRYVASDMYRYDYYVVEGHDGAWYIVAERGTAQAVLDHAFGREAAIHRAAHLAWRGVARHTLGL